MEENQGSKGGNGQHAGVPQKIQSNEDQKAQSPDNQKADNFCHSWLNGAEGLEARLQWVGLGSEWVTASADNSLQTCARWEVRAGTL